MTKKEALEEVACVIQWAGCPYEVIKELINKANWDPEPEPKGLTFEEPLAAMKEGKE